MNRDNLMGGLFLVFMGVLATILVRAIITGERPDITLSPAVSTILTVLFIGGIIYGIWQSGVFSRWFGNRDRNAGGRHWPDPQTGRKSLWDRLRGR